MSRKTRGCDACCLDSEKFNPKTTQELPFEILAILDTSIDQGAAGESRIYFLQRR